MRAETQGVHDYLIDEANLRGFLGAYRSSTPERPLDSALELEDLVVGLLAPQAPVEARIFKLVVRILQSGNLSATKLFIRSRREAAEPALYWLLHQIPPEEQNAAIEALLAQVPQPRGYRPLDYRYDAQRLIRRPARKNDLWRKPPRSS